MATLTFDTRTLSPTQPVARILDEPAGIAHQRRVGRRVITPIVCSAVALLLIDLSVVWLGHGDVSLFVRPAPSGFAFWTGPSGTDACRLGNSKRDGTAMRVLLSRP